MRVAVPSLCGGKVSYGDRRRSKRTTIYNADINITRPLFPANNERSTSRNVALVGVVEALVARCPYRATKVICRNRNLLRNA